MVMCVLCVHVYIRCGIVLMKVIQMDNMCGIVNDIIDISFLENNYSHEEYCGLSDILIPVHSGLL